MSVKEFLNAVKFNINYMQQIPLNYATNALEPFIDQATIEIHYGKHHATYLANLNKIISEEFPEYNDKTVEEILLGLQSFPENRRTAILNNAGQVYNHDLYWQSIKPGEQKYDMTDEFYKLFDKWGSSEGHANYFEFEKLWKEAGLTQFGSGWVWLSIDSSGDLFIDKTSNADSPLLHGKKPILTMDVWEHAYYLKYQNKRGDYIDNFFKIIDWAGVSDRYSKAITK